MAEPKVIEGWTIGRSQGGSVYATRFDEQHARVLFVLDFDEPQVIDGMQCPPASVIDELRRLEKTND